MTLLVPTLVRMSLTSMLRSRRLLLASLVAAIPLLLAGALMASDATRADPAGTSRPEFSSNVAKPLEHLVIGGTVPFIAMLLAGAIVADDVEDRTFSYILVRPLRRHQIYLSRLVPAAAIAAVLALAQVLGYTLLRLLAWSLYGQGTQETVYRDGATITMTTLSVVLAQGAMGLLAAVLAAVAFLALFSFVTVLTTKYHFLANVLLFVSFELLFGNLGGQGAGVLTITFHARSLMHVAGGDDGYHAAAWWVAIPLLLAMTGFWTWLAARRMGHRDFNVTSAAS